MQKVMLMVWVMLMLAGAAGCAVDPRLAADAQVKLLAGQEQAADAQAARVQREAEAKIKLAEAQAASAQWIESWNFFVRWWMFFATWSVSLATGTVLLGLALGGAWALVGMGRAVSIAANSRARQIPMNAETGSFPLLQYEGKGMMTVTDMNTGKTVSLDTRNEADRQMIAGAFAVRLNSVVAVNARKAGKAAGDVSLVGTHPAVVGAKENGLTVGEIMEDGDGN